MTIIQGAAQLNGVTLTASATINVTAPAGKTLFGCSQPGWPLLKPKMVRTYEPGLPSGWAGSNASRVTGVPLHASIKPQPGSLVSGASSAAVLAFLQGLPDGSLATIQHEPENPSKNLNAALYKADQPHFLDLIDEANKGRKTPIEGVQVFMAYSLLTAGQGGPSPARDIAGTWWSPDPRFKKVGFDDYSNLSLQFALQFAHDHGQTLVVPEYGYAAATTVPPDATYLARIEADLPLLKQTAVVLLWDQANDAITNDPKTLAYWQSLNS